MAGRPREFDEAEVVEEALDAFLEHGFRGTPLGELVDRTGVGRQSLYNAFGDKHVLRERALELYRERHFGPMLALLGRDGRAIDNLRATLEHVVALATGGEFHGCLVVNSMAELGDDEPEVATLLLECLRAVEAAFARTLARAREEGDLSRDKDPGQLAKVIVTNLVGISALARLDLARSHAPALAATLAQLLT